MPKPFKLIAFILNIAIIVQIGTYLLLKISILKYENTLLKMLKPNNISIIAIANKIRFLPKFIGLI